MGLTLLQGPEDPLLVSLEEAKAHLRVTSDEEDSLVEGLVLAATEQAEAYCRRKFLTQKWRATFDCFSGDALVLPFPPLQSVQSVKYLAPAGQEQTLATTDYLVRVAEVPGEIVPAYGKAWPSTRLVPDAVKVEFTCGYGDPDEVPEGIRRAVLLIVGSLYANRETVAPVSMQPVPQSAEWLLGPYRVLRW